MSRLRVVTTTMAGALAILGLAALALICGWQRPPFHGAVAVSPPGLAVIGLAMIGLAAIGLAAVMVLALHSWRLAQNCAVLRALADDLHIAKRTADAASDAKSRFLATMSHELRTPLNAVIGFSEIITHETFGPVGKAAYREYAADILHSGHHMLDLVNDILTMAKLEAGRYELEPVPLDLRHLVERTVTMFLGAKHAEGRRIRVGPDQPWPSISADERAVRQMLLNLLSNAAKFSDPATPIEVICRRGPNREIVLAVADRGIGMTPNEAAEAVRPFYQADNRLGRKYEGTGLGLSIVSGLIGCHAGHLRIDSQPGIGTEVSLLFPASALTAAPRLAAVA
ncbi:MAG: sensor histidine kinase [Thiohalocapsa sp.]